MRKIVLQGLAFFLFAAAVSAGTFVVTDPRRAATPDQEKIVAFVVKQFCYPDPNKPGDFYWGSTSAAARFSIDYGLGPLALAEVTKCRVTKTSQSIMAATRSRKEEMTK